MKINLIQKSLVVAVSSTLLCSVALAKKLNNEIPVISPGDNQEILANTEKTALHFTQQLTPDDQITLGDIGLSVSSKSYYQEITGQQFKSGVSIITHGSEAIVRVTPAKSTVLGKTSVAPSIEPADLELSGNAGQFNVNKSGMSVTARSDQLNKAHPELFKNASAFTIDKQMGAGKFALKTNKSVADDSRYLIHVFDKNSNVELNLGSQVSSYANGDKLSVSAGFNRNQKFDTGSVTATLIAPDGRSFPMNVKNMKSGTNAEIDLSMNTNRRPGELWKVVFDASASGSTIKRTGELAIDIHEKTASVSSVDNAKGQMQVTLNVSKAGRYEVRSWQFTQNGKINEPDSIEYFANWFEEGTHTITLPVSTQKKGSIKPVQIQLLDQSRLAVLQTITM
ncbi:MAG: DUF4785 family protein [Gammaproteobacteria bacterium]|nr:DUF4785 family protein [Gammaproteobacteria bacterium]